MSLQLMHDWAGIPWRNVVVEAAKSLFLFLTALFPIIDPLGESPIFLAMAREYSPSMQRELSRRIAMNSFFLLVGSYFIAAHVLAFFGISLPVVQVGGGLVVIATGWALLKQGNINEPKEVKQNTPPNDPFRNAFYPLTLPLPCRLTLGDWGWTLDRTVALGLLSGKENRLVEALSWGIAESFLKKVDGTRSAPYFHGSQI